MNELGYRPKRPARLRERSIGEMRPGDEGWTMPRAVHRPKGCRWLFADYYLNAAFPVSPEPSVGATLKVMRRNDGWHIDDSQFRRGFSDTHPEQIRELRSVAVRSITL